MPVGPERAASFVAELAVVISRYSAVCSRVAATTKPLLLSLSIASLLFKRESADYKMGFDIISPNRRRLNNDARLNPARKVYERARSHSSELNSESANLISIHTTTTTGASGARVAHLFGVLCFCGGCVCVCVCVCWRHLLLVRLSYRLERLPWLLLAGGRACFALLWHRRCCRRRRRRVRSLVRSRCVAPDAEKSHTNTRSLARARLRSNSLLASHTHTHTDSREEPRGNEFN